MPVRDESCDARAWYRCNNRVFWREPVFLGRSRNHKSVRGTAVERAAAERRLARRASRSSEPTLRRAAAPRRCTRARRLARPRRSPCTMVEPSRRSSRSAAKPARFRNDADTRAASVEVERADALACTMVEPSRRSSRSAAKPARFRNDAEDVPASKVRRTTRGVAGLSHPGSRAGLQLADVAGGHGDESPSRLIPDYDSAGAISGIGAATPTKSTRCASLPCSSLPCFPFARACTG